MLLLSFVSTLLHSSQADGPIHKGLYKDIFIGNVDGVAITINVAFPEKLSTKPRPVVLLIHGGGFISGNKNDKDRQILKLSKLGFVAASAMYRLAPEYKYPDAINDVKLAIRFLKSKAKAYHLDPERIIVSGSSAGSYLAVMVGVTGNSNTFNDYGLYPDFSSSVRAVTAQSAPIGDFRLLKYAQRPTVKRLLPCVYTNEQSVLAAMSPITYLDVNDPPFFLSHGDEDPIVPVEMSREFASELKKIGHDFEYFEVKGGTHHFGRSAPEQAKIVFSNYLKFLSKWSK